MTRFSRFFAGLLLAVLSLNTLGVAAQPGNSAKQKGPPEHVRQAFLKRFEGARLERLQNAISAQNRHTNSLMQNQGVIGTAVSWDENDEAVIKIYTELNASAVAVPASVDGIRIVIEPTGKIYAQNVRCETRGNCPEPPLVEAAAAQPPNQRDWHPRPVPIGVSTGHPDVSAGTLACRVSNGCHKYALSNAHVYADENAGLQGDNILQPGAFDGGINPDDAIATLYASIPIIMGTTPSVKNEVDAAIADTTAADVGVSTRTNGYGTPISVSKDTALDPAVGMDVQKYGRSSARTYGYIDAINATINVAYDEGDARFIKQMIIKTDTAKSTRNFSSAGDSGALIVASGGADDRKAVGLLFASGSIGEEHITVANPIKKVLELLDVKIDGE